MFNNQTGKLLVYTSSFSSSDSQLKPVSIAAEKLARLLNVNIEVRTFDERFAPIYVYYKNGEEEPIPIYCNNGGETSIKEVCAALRNMMFVLSFHPKHSALRQMRKEIMRFS